ncbi:transcriptional regulator, SarA/Rot family [Staphylococcus saprophyticus]
MLKQLKTYLKKIISIKKRNEHDERTVLILVNTKQRKKINELLSRVNDRIKEANDEKEV